jgi:uncharacterized protein YutD
MELDKIGFYTLCDSRAENVSATSQMQRCEIIINEYCNFKCPYCRGLDDSIFSDRKRKEKELSEKLEKARREAEERATLEKLKEKYHV